MHSIFVDIISKNFFYPVFEYHIVLQSLISIVLLSLQNLLMKGHMDMPFIHTVLFAIVQTIDILTYEHFRTKRKYTFFRVHVNRLRMIM